MKRSDFSSFVICGIYQLRCVVNQKIYIGSSKDIYRRALEHISYLRFNKHPNIILQRSYNRHGENNFILDILEECPENLLIKAEQAWLDIIQPFDGGIGYNIARSAYKPEAKRNTDRFYIREPRSNIDIEVSDLYGFCKKNKLNAERMKRVAKGKQEKYKGYHCRYISQSYEFWLENLDIPIRATNLDSNGNTKKRIVTYPDGTENIIINLSKFCKDNNLILGGMLLVASSRYSQHKGYKCRHFGQTREEWEVSYNIKRKKKGRGWKGEYVITRPDGLEETIFSLRKYCRDNNLCHAHMLGVANGKQSHCHSFKCRYSSQSKDDWENMINTNLTRFNKTNRKYLIIKPDGTEEISYNLNQYSRKNNLGRSSMNRIASGQYKQYKGYKCIELTETQENSCKSIDKSQGSDTIIVEV